MIAMEKKIGIMGGTFNPVHYGHLLLAEQAREELLLDEILFMPSGNSYMKDQNEILDGEDRASMLALAIEGHPDFRLSRMELDRKGPTYTADTLLELKEKFPQNTYYFIMGADSLLMLENWKNPDVILQNAVIAVAVRGAGNTEKIKLISMHLKNTYGANIQILSSRFVDISSSEIRQRIRDGKSIRYLLPEHVQEYILKNHLYQNK